MKAAKYCLSAGTASPIKALSELNTEIKTSGIIMIMLHITAVYAKIINPITSIDLRTRDGRLAP